MSTIIGSGTSQAQQFTEDMQTDAFQACVGVFGIAVGTTYLDAIATYMTSSADITTDNLYEVLLSSEVASQFGYYSYLTPSAFANKLAANLLPASIDAEAVSAFKTAVVAAIDAGYTKAQVAQLAVEAVAAVATDDPNYGPARAQLDNRVSVAEYYTLTAEGASTNLTVLTDILASVTDVAGTVDTAKDSIDDGIEIGTGETYSLTTGADAGTGFTGGSGNDVFEAGESAGLKTLTAGDNLKGGAGTDTLNVSADAATNYAGFYTDSIEVINATSDAAQTFDLSGATGLTTVKSSNSAAATTFNEVTSLVDLEVVNLTNTGAASNVTVQYQAAVVAGTADAMKVTLNNSNAQNITIGNTANAAAGIETINLVANGANSTVNTLNTDLTTLNFSGDKNVTITNALNNTVRTINADGATGGLTVSTNTVNALTFTGGAGDDQVTFAAGTLTALDSVTGGTGNDRLVANQADLMAASARVSGVEYIRVQDTLTGTQGADTPATNLDASKYADATRFELAAGYNAARIDNLNATQQRVDILNNQTGAGGVNTGTLQIDDGATSAAADQFTIALGQTTANNRVNATVGFVSGEIETVNLISNGTTVAGGNTINLTAGGMGNVNTLNITGSEDLTVTSAGSVVTSIAAGAATGDLDLDGVTLSATAGATITTGSGDDQVTGGVKADTINVGAGDDVVTASQGADSITLGDGIDTVVYANLNESNSAATDTITDFVSGTDVLDISGLGATAYAGTKATFALAQGALAAGGVVSSVFQADTSTLWVDMDGNGTLDANDFRVVMNGVSTLAAASVATGGGNAFTVTAGVANPGNAFNNTFTATDTDLQTALTTVDGLAGIDTLNITTDAAGAYSLAGVLTSIERVNLQAGQTVGAVTIHNEDNVVVNAAAASIVVLGTGDNQSFNGSAGGDDVTLSAANQNVSAAGGADTVRSTVANLVNSNLDLGGGVGDTLAVTDAGTVDLRGGAGQTTVSGLEAVTLTGASTLRASINALNVTVGAGNTTITNNGTTQTVDATALGAGNTLTLNGTAASTVTNLTGAGDAVTVAAGAGATSISVDVADASAHTITNNSSNTVTITETGIAGTGANAVTVTGSGNFNITTTGGVANGINVVTNAGTAGTVAVDLNGAGTITGLGTGTLTVDALGVGAGAAVTLATAGTQNATIQLDEGDLALAGTYTGNLTVTSTAGAAATTQTIVTGAGTDSITFTALGAASGATSSTVRTGTGADQITIGTNAVAVTIDGDTAGHLSNAAVGVDVITGFRAGVDTIDANSVFGGALVAGASTNAVTTAGLAAEIGTIIAGLGAGFSGGDAALISFTNYNGGAATFLFVDDDANDAFTATDTLVQLVGTVGVITAVDIA